MGTKTKYFSHIYQWNKVTFSDNVKGKVIDKGKVRKPPNYVINDVQYIEGLKYNLLSISQFCDKGNQVIFNTNKFLVINKLVGKRINNIYLIDLYFESILDC